MCKNFINGVFLFYLLYIASSHYKLILFSDFQKDKFGEKNNDFILDNREMLNVQNF